MTQIQWSRTGSFSPLPQPVFRAHDHHIETVIAKSNVVKLRDLIDFIDERRLC